MPMAGARLHPREKAGDNNRRRLDAQQEQVVMSRFRPAAAASCSSLAYSSPSSLNAKCCANVQNGAGLRDWQPQPTSAVSGAAEETQALQDLEDLSRGGLAVTWPRKNASRCIIQVAPKTAEASRRCPSPNSGVPIAQDQAQALVDLAALQTDGAQVNWS